MGLFYAEEHKGCCNYSTINTAGFISKTFKQGERLERDVLGSSVLAFLLKGKIRITCNSFCDIVISNRTGGGKFFLLPQNACCYGVALEDSEMIGCLFSQDMQMCNRYSLSNLQKELEYIPPKEYVNKFTILDTIPYIDEFLSFLMKLLAEGLGCVHFHSMKRDELFLLLRAFYPKEDLARLFYPVIGRNMDFKDFVLSHYKEVADIKEFAQLANLSLSTFNRRFKESFQQSAQKWIATRRAEEVLRDIRMTNFTFEELAHRHHFSSASYFASFCKKYYGMTPREVRNSKEGIVLKGKLNSGD